MLVYLQSRIPDHVSGQLVSGTVNSKITFPESSIFKGSIRILKIISFDAKQPVALCSTHDRRPSRILTLILAALSSSCLVQE